VSAHDDELIDRLGIELPIVQAPMAGSSGVALAVAVARVGGLGSLPAAMLTNEQLAAQVDEFRHATEAPLNLNFFCHIEPQVSRAQLDAWSQALARFDAELGVDRAGVLAGASRHPFDEDACQLVERCRPEVVSFHFGLPAPQLVERVRSTGAVVMSSATTVAEAIWLESHGCDVVIAQGAEAGGHRGCFDAATAERQLVGLFSLLPAVVDAVKVPVVATGGIADARGVAAALALGASAAQVGTGFLRCPEAKIAPAWADALGRTLPEDTLVSRVFSGRAGRSIATDYVKAATAPDAPAPAPYPVQRGLTAGMRSAGQQEGDVQRMQAWAGQSAALARAAPAAEVVHSLWDGARKILAA
jgi:nitronate monooxygenase